MNNASANVVYLPDNAWDPIPLNTAILIAQEGAGQTSVQGITGSVAVNGITGGIQLCAAQYSPITIIKRSTNGWVAWGDIE